MAKRTAPSAGRAELGSTRAHPHERTQPQALRRYAGAARRPGARARGALDLGTTVRNPAITLQGYDYGSALFIRYTRQDYSCTEMPPTVYT